MDRLRELFGARGAKKGPDQQPPAYPQASPERINQVIHEVAEKLRRRMYSSVSGNPQDTARVVDALVTKFADDHLILRTAITKEDGSIDEVRKILTEQVAQAIRPEVEQSRLSTMDKFGAFCEGVAVKSDKPIIIILEDLQNMGVEQDRDSLIRGIRALFNERASNPGVDNLTFLLTADRPPDKLLVDPKLTPYNIGEHVTL